MKSPCIYVVLRSSGPSQRGRIASVEEEWGYQITARAPVSAESVQRLRAEMNATYIDEGMQFSTKACKEALQVCVNDIMEAKAYLKRTVNSRSNFSSAIAVTTASASTSGGPMASSTHSSGFVGCFERSMGNKSVHLQTFEIFENASSLTDLPYDLWRQWDTFLYSPAGGEAPPDNIVKQTKNMDLHRIVCPRKGESIIFEIRVWTRPEETPSREMFYANQSKAMHAMVTAKDMSLGNGGPADDSLANIGQMYCDYGLHGIENLSTLNHPSLQPDGNLKHLGKLYSKCNHYEHAPHAIWVKAVREFRSFFEDREPPRIWVLLEEQSLSVDQLGSSVNKDVTTGQFPLLIAWIVGNKFANSAFFEVFDSPSGAVHVYIIRRFAGRSFRQAVYSSNANETTAMLPNTLDNRFFIQTGGKNQREICKGLLFDRDVEPEFMYEQGHLFGYLTFLTDRSNSEGNFSR